MFERNRLSQGFRRVSLASVSIVLWVGLGLGLCVDRASATAVIPIQDDRSSYSYRQTCEPDCGPVMESALSPPSDFADWSEVAFGRTLHSSTVGGLLMTGSAEGTYSGDYGTYIYEAAFDVTFEVVDPTQVHLTGSLYSFDWFDNPTSLVGIELFGPGEVLRYSAEHIPDEYGGNTTIDFLGVLTPGEYRLFAHTDMQPTFLSSATYDFNLAISPIAAPEPGTALLLGLGLAGLTRRGIGRWTT